MERYTPPFVAPRRVLTLDELRKRGFGEALYSQLTPCLLYTSVLASPKNAQPGKIFFGPFRFARAAERRERHAEPNQQQARRQ